MIGVYRTCVNTNSERKVGARSLRWTAAQASNGREVCRPRALPRHNTANSPPPFNLHASQPHITTHLRTNTPHFIYFSRTLPRVPPHPPHAHTTYTCENTHTHAQTHYRYGNRHLQHSLRTSPHSLHLQHRRITTSRHIANQQTQQHLITTNTTATATRCDTTSATCYNSSTGTPPPPAP